VFRHILIATDGSDLAQKATTNGLALAKAVGASVTAVTVFIPFHMYDVLPSGITKDLSDAYAEYVEDVNTESFLNDVAEMASARGVRCQVMQVEQNQPHEAIVDIAVRKNCDLIVMASHRRRGIAAMLLGSVTAKVLARTTIPVLVYH
jgi:nucleotide-binding universal stress UspA family protein